MNSNGSMAEAERNEQGTPEPPGDGSQAPNSAAAFVAAPGPSPDMVKAMEERLRRLESALATMQEPHAEPEGQGLRQPRESLREKAGRLADAGRKLLPMAAGLMRSSESATPAAETNAGKSPWLLVEAFHELRAIGVMYFDRRYQVSWVGWIIPLVGLLIIATDRVFLESIPLMGRLLENMPILAKPLYMLIELLTAFFMFKVLTREARRYNQTLADASRR